jgi:metal-dependent hydrolase (beta-lactamase superfamily II)
LTTTLKASGHKHSNENNGLQKFQKESRQPIKILKDKKKKKKRRKRKRRRKRRRRGRRRKEEEEE